MTNVTKEIIVDEETGEVVEPEEKRKRGRPKKSAVAVKKGGSTYPGDKNGMFFTTVKDESSRKEIVSQVMKGAIDSYLATPVKTDEEVINRIELYFTRCSEEGILPTVEGLSLSLGVTRQALLDWENGKYNQSRAPIIARAKEVIAEVDAQLVAMGKMPAIPYIFRAKNYYGMSDKTELQVSQSTYNNLSEEELKRSIRETIIDAEFTEK